MRRVIAKVEWHPGELYPRVGFIVTNMSRPAERVVAFYNKRGTCEQWIKEGACEIHVGGGRTCRDAAAQRCQLTIRLKSCGAGLNTLAFHFQRWSFDNGIGLDILVSWYTRRLSSLTGPSECRPTLQDTRSNFSS
jgi:hypothetical protein